MLLYITASSGVVLNVHYCMGKVSSVKVDNFNEELCSCGAEAAEMACCFSELKVVKLDDSHKAAVVAQQVQMPVADLPTYLSAIDLFKKLPVVQTQQLVHDPPLLSTPDVYLRNRVFRI
jgi:hypothetical protein